MELLAALGEHRDVHLWLPHPSAALWDSLAGTAGAVPRQADDSHLQVGHPLLASLGRDVRELQRTLQRRWLRSRAHAALVPQPPGAPASVVASEERASRTTGGRLLSWLQQDIAANATADRSSRTLDPADRSVQVHACHGPARQVEVLREVLLGLLADDPRPASRRSSPATSW